MTVPDLGRTRHQVVYAIVCILTLFFGTLAIAQQPVLESARIDAARNLYWKASNMTDERLKSMLTPLMQQFGGEFKRRFAEHVQRDAIGKLIDSITEKMVDRRIELVELWAVTFAEPFAQQELVDLTAYFSISAPDRPTDKPPHVVKFEQLRPGLLKKYISLTTEWGAKIGGDLGAALDQEILARGIQL
jgi:hypothetical protein